MASCKRNRRILFGVLFGALLASAWGCVTELPRLADPAQVTDSLVVGRVVTVITGERSRRYLPQMRSLELEDQDSQKRYQVEIESPAEYFAIDVPPGRYRLNRVQINEGPFMSMADLDMTFSADPGGITHVGTWRFGVESPRYGRKVAVSMVVDQEDGTQVREFLKKQYPNFNENSIVARLPQPSQVEARLYEVAPYPRISRYFRRHWW